MNDIERRLYEAVVAKILHLKEKESKGNIAFVERMKRGRMVRIRQSLSNPFLLSSAVEGYEENLISGNSDLFELVVNYRKLEQPGKITRLLEIVNSLLQEDEKVVIWSNFIGTVELIQNSLNKNNITSKKIIGEVPVERIALEEAETREKIISEFNDSKSDLKVLVANPAACAESVSLHKSCKTAIYYDLSFNGAQYIQSLDRIHRVGGSEKKEANYFFLQYEDTVEYRILENLLLKKEKMESLIEQDYSVYTLDMFADEEDDLVGYREIFDD